MGLRFHRSIKLIPGVRLNIWKRGIGVSAGVRGLRAGVDARGRKYVTAGLPGTGISSTSYAAKRPAIVAPDDEGGTAPQDSGARGDGARHPVLRLVFVVVIVAAFVYLAAISIKP